jgi:hypothetical protein
LSGGKRPYILPPKKFLEKIWPKII